MIIQLTRNTFFHPDGRPNQSYIGHKEERLNVHLDNGRVYLLFNGERYYGQGEGFVDREASHMLNFKEDFPHAAVAHRRYYAGRIFVNIDMDVVQELHETLQEIIMTFRFFRPLSWNVMRLSFAMLALLLLISVI